MCGHPRARDAVSVGFVRRESGGWLVTHAPWHSPCSVGQCNLPHLARTVCNSAPRWAGTLQAAVEHEIAKGRTYRIELTYEEERDRSRVAASCGRYRRRCPCAATVQRG